MASRPLEGLSSMTDSPEGEGSPLARAMARDCVIATKPRALLGWLVPAGFCPPPPGGSCSIVTPEGDVWCGIVVSVLGRRVRIRLFGSGVVALFVDCACQPLRPHSRADARRIFELQRCYQPAARAARFTKGRPMKSEPHDTDTDDRDNTAVPTEPARHAVGFRLGADHLSADRFRDQPENV
jgi:hypothetical protein